MGSRGLGSRVAFSGHGFWSKTLGQGFRPGAQVLGQDVRACVQNCHGNERRAETVIRHFIGSRKESLGLKEVSKIQM